ncbi:hypothetical protein UFOVP314_45 [uncultured Caudovirales phage]|uniref:Minor tail protein n=1 Tax=uncultured Caudovirales phage TaxID=2100421 RepID=A0A6J5LYQ6_9CAUD|nr:hypothetical protein UFOVP314_45 [uncultured Caudovirales phage]
MPVETLPWSIQGQSHPATVARNHTAAMLGAPAAAESPSVSLTAGGAHGVVNGGDLAVTQNGTPNMSVNVAAGRAFIRGTQTAGSLNQGVYSFFNDGTVNLAVSSADPTNPRRDLVVAQIRDSNYSGSANDARLFVVTGTPAASPTDPVVPADTLVLARLSVAAGATSVTNANITDLRVFARTPLRTAWGFVAQASVTAQQNGITTVTDLTGLTVTWTAIASRRYRVTAAAEINGTVAGDLLIVYITDGSNTIQQRAVVTVPSLNSGGGYAHARLELHLSNVSGSVTRKLRLERNAGTGTAGMFAAATTPAYLTVEDIGPV